MIKIKYLNLLVISQHYRVTIKEFIVIIFVSHTSPKTRNFWHKLRSTKARPHSVKTLLLTICMQMADRIDFIINNKESHIFVYNVFC